MLINLNSYKELVINDIFGLERLFKAGVSPRDYDRFAIEYAYEKKDLKLSLLCAKYGYDISNIINFLPQTFKDNIVEFIYFIKNEQIKIPSRYFYTILGWYFEKKNILNLEEYFEINFLKDVVDVILDNVLPETGNETEDEKERKKNVQSKIMSELIIGDIEYAKEFLDNSFDEFYFDQEVFLNSLPLKHISNKIKLEIFSKTRNFNKYENKTRIYESLKENEEIISIIDVIGMSDDIYYLSFKENIFKFNINKCIEIQRGRDMDDLFWSELFMSLLKMIGRNIDGSTNPFIEKTLDYLLSIRNRKCVEEDELIFYIDKYSKSKSIVKVFIRELKRTTVGTKNKLLSNLSYNSILRLREYGVFRFELKRKELAMMLLEHDNEEALSSLLKKYVFDTVNPDIDLIYSILPKLLLSKKTYLARALIINQKNSNMQFELYRESYLKIANLTGQDIPELRTQRNLNESNYKLY